MKNHLEFLVQGSRDEPYEVTFLRRSERNLSAYCTCQAGEHGLYCRHRFGLMDGDTSKLVSENVDDVFLLLNWLPGSDIADALDEVRLLEKEFSRTKNRLTEAKHALAKAMLD